MIALGSKSYPYLAVAQHYRVSYSEVLKYVDLMDKHCDIDLFPIVLDKHFWLEWELDTAIAWKNEQLRRKQVLGV